jgi:outer membrane lipoprotein-sorting protein
VRARIGTTGLAALGGLLLAAAAGAGELLPPPPAADAHEIARREEEVLRGDTAVMEATMTIVSPRLSAPRTVRFQSWDDRRKHRSFVRILAPPKDAGTAFLMERPNLWMYLPRVERTMRIPPSMMLQSWMGSDFTNDDLVRESSTLDDYDQKLLGVDPSPPGHPGLRAYVVEFRPHEDAPVVWGKIVAWIETEHATPLRQEYYDESGTRLRVFELDEIRPVQGRYFPHRWSMTPLDQEGHRTVVEIQEIRFDEKLDDAIFTTHNLKARP